MLWWSHLLVRRRDTLKKRCAVFERLARALGDESPLSSTTPLLIRRIFWANTVVTCRLRGEETSVLDKPSWILADQVSWRRCGVIYDRNGPHWIWLRMYDDRIVLRYADYPVLVVNSEDVRGDIRYITREMAAGNFRRLRN